MDGKTLPRIGAIAFVAIAITVAVIEMREQVGSEVTPPPAPAITSTDPLRAELIRCQSIGQAAASDAACLHAWANNRQRFLGRSVDAAQPLPAIPAVGTTTVTAAGDPVDQGKAMSLSPDAGAR